MCLWLISKCSNVQTTVVSDFGETIKFIPLTLVPHNMAQDLLLHILNCYYYYTVGKLSTNLSNPVVFAAAGLTLTSPVYRVVRPGLRCAVNDIKVYLGMIKVCV